MTRPSWLGRAARPRHRHAIEQASHRWRGGRRAESGRTRRKSLISTQWVDAVELAEDVRLAAEHRELGPQVLALEVAGVAADEVERRHARDLLLIPVGPPRLGVITFGGAVYRAQQPGRRAVGSLLGPPADGDVVAVEEGHHRVAVLAPKKSSFAS